MHGEPLVYRIHIAMEKLGLSRATIYRMAARGDLKLIKLGRRASGITADSIKALIERGSAS
ncbi:helix-turn-helix transcriptional regulator [Burkholderia sp. BCC1998]|uniref:helix-turn-helix transcriptional regulator n=1 Tax=Burkholderia sp. BCC1998 TaxID=2817447 RepID=UPI002AB70C6B|nr:helix-turn-helix domain-containing protein [Burkholderia sp. BCC1998]